MGAWVIRKSIQRAAVFLGMGVALAGCGENSGPRAERAPAEAGGAPVVQAARAATTQAVAQARAATGPLFVPLSDPHLPNARWVTSKVINGGQPEGEAGFRKLQELGVKTIISVDGISPNVTLAHKYGMRYIHLPFGYDGVPFSRGEEIAKALREMPGPIYVHCHHGRHRSATATAVACVMNGMIPPSEALAILRTWGTGKNYKGLWESAREARPLGPGVLERLQVTYVEQAKIPALAEAMVHVDFYADHLGAIQKAGWRTPADHPDLDPPHEALQLEEMLVEIGRSSSATTRPVDFRQRLETAVQRAHGLRELLEMDSIDTAAADRAWKQVNQACLSCHAKYRD